MLERKVCKIGKEWYGGGIVQGVFDIDSGKALLIVDEASEFHWEVAEIINKTGEQVRADLTKLPKECLERQDQLCLVSKETGVIMAAIADVEFADKVMTLFSDSAT